MNHFGWGWLVGSMALQLVACGDALPGVASRDAPEQRRPAQPERSEHGTVPNDAAPPATFSTDAQPAEPVITSPAGWETVQCAGAATRRISMSGNLDAETSMFPPWYGAFTAEDPANYSNFSVTFATFDDQGRQQSTSVYFRREQGWDYHVVMDGTAYVIGEGHLTFDEQGALLSTEVTQELRLLTPTGPGHAVELDLTGMTNLFDYTTLTGLTVDGTQARWGTSCAVAQAMPDEPPVTGPECAAAATTRLALRANLAASSPIASQPWDPLAPDAELTTLLTANDAHGTVIDFALHLRKASAQTWDYHVLLSGEAPGQEVASGALHFNPNGSLESVTTAHPLRFPNRAGLLGDPIQLDFGASTAEGGTGVDGVTALGGASFEVWQQHEGAVLDCLPRATTPLPASHSPRCAGERTTAIQMNVNLDPGWPLDTVSYQATATVYDAALQSHGVQLQFQHFGPRRWQCHVSEAGVEVGVVDLEFTEHGAPQRIENIPTLRLPLADGSAGPPIQLAFEEGWAITAFASPNHGWLAPNGAAPNADGCVP